MTDSAALKAKGNAEFSAGNFSAAIESFTQAIAVDPDNHVLYSNRSGAYVGLGDFAKAKADAESCVQKKPDWFKSYSRLGAALHGLKQYDEAVSQYEKAMGMASGGDVQKIQSSLDDVKRDKEAASGAGAGAGANPFAKIFGPDCLAKIAANPKLQPYLLKPGFEQKIRMIQSNPAMLNSLMQDQDVMMCALELMGISGKFATAGGDDDDVKQQPAAAAAARPAPAPEAPKPAASKPAPKAAAAAAAPLTPAQQAKEEGTKLYLARKFDEALAKYDEAFSLDNTCTTYLLNRTAVLFEQGKYETVLEECDKALEHAREHKADYQIVAKTMTRRASALQKLGQHEEAIKLFKSALLEHRNAETLNKLHACEAEKKKLDEEAYLDPELSKKAKEEGNEEYKKGNFPAAVKCYDEAIKRNPKDHIPYSNRAGTLLKLAAYEDAIRDCDKCISICPTFARAYARKAQAYMLTKQLHKAMATYEEGLQQDPENQECLEGKQRVMYKIQEVSSSEGNEEYAARAVESDPELQRILQDPNINLVLKNVQQDPSRLAEYMRDPQISAAINKLVAAGVIRTGPAGGAPPQGMRR